MAAETTTQLDVALAHAERLLGRDPLLAIEQADAILEVAPRHPRAEMVKARALQWQGKPEGDATIQRLAREQPRWADAQFELGRLRAAVGEYEGAIAAYRDALDLRDVFPIAWGALGDALYATGALLEADDAYANQIRTSTSDPVLMNAAAALCANKLAPAEAMLRSHLKAQPTDVAAIRMLAEVGARLGRYRDSELLLLRAIELAPSFAPARHNLALVLLRQGKVLEALREVETLRRAEGDNPQYRNLQAAALARLGDFDAALALYAEIIREQPREPRLWLSYGHALKTAGRTEKAVRAYREAAKLNPDFGDAYWSLANLKTFRFTADETAAMRAALERELREDDCFHVHYALGKALEDVGDYEQSFAHYAEGARRRRACVDYDPEQTSEQVRRIKALFTADFLAAHRGMGAPARDPIFVIGLPRSGSTLIEQILSSHSLIEGTTELPDISAIARELGERKLRSQPTKYPEVLAELSADRLLALGERYIERTRIQRRTQKPMFIDKMPNNWLHAGLIMLILPNAKIIDARRDPMATCFSAFKQHFARGQTFTYDLGELGRYYRDYVELMAHFDAVAPGRIYPVQYERLVADTEREVRQVLAYCGATFEAGCLEFYATERAVRTASSEQVRRPIYREGLEQWRHYERWLAPLREALGATVTE